MKAVFPLALNTDSSVYLTDLTLSSGTLSPAFSSSITSYSAAADSSVSSVTVTPVANFSSASITVNGTAVISGNPSGNIALSTGSNTVSVTVTGSGGSSKTYSIEITKSASAASAAVSAELTSLSTSQGTLSPVF
ncbi:MAG TPA: cadherin-like beta sandwich domain-containing protein, partial [Leptospiraceae bacterium]|nr:cadherin-like beta sandwich domain-containing protein [Leptospiraceae bacterium]